MRANHIPCSLGVHKLIHGEDNSFIIDILDSLKLFGMEDEFNKCRNWVMDLSFDIDDKFHTFEVRSTLLLVRDLVLIQNV